MAGASAPHDRAAALIDAGRPDEARALLLAALAASPDDARLHYLLGAAQHAAGAPEAALASFARAASLDPMLLAARQGHAAMLLVLGRTDAALAESAGLVENFPDDVQNLANHALLLLQLRRDAAGALALWDRALGLRPDLEPALLNRGTLLLELGQAAAAAANARAFVATHPANPRAHAQLGEALLAGGNCEAALSVLDRALTLAPGTALLHVKRGYALAALRRFAAAGEAFDTARSLDPDAVDGFRRSLAAGRGALPDLDPEAIYLARGYERQLECDWSGRDAFLGVLRGSIARDGGPPTERGLLFASLSLPLTPGERLALARAASAHVASGARPMSREAPGSGRLRIGYVSPDFRHHVTARLVHPVFAAHDRLAFEIFAYALCPGDGSELRAAVERAPDAFRDLSGVDDASAAQLIARDRLDVLVDLGGYTLGSRTEILAMRPAPVQAAWLGFPSTMGADFIDYAFVDRVIAAQREAWHEQPVFLPQTFFVYPPGAAPGPTAASRRDYGLPEDAIVLCAFHHPRKIDPGAFSAWMEVLRAVPRSVLWLTAAETDYVPNLRHEAAARGVAPERLVSAPRESHDRYMARLALADLFLDAFLYNAVSTACDALWMALPVLTLCGDTPTSRAAASILRASALPDLVTATPDAFVALAVRLASDAAARANTRQRVQASRTTSPVFDIPGRARALETAFRVMVERARRGLPPAPVDTGPGATPVAAPAASS